MIKNCSAFKINFKFSFLLFLIHSAFACTVLDDLDFSPVGVEKELAGEIAGAASSAFPVLALPLDGFYDNGALKPESIDRALDQMGFAGGSEVKILRCGQECSQVFSAARKIFKVVDSPEEGDFLRLVRGSSISQKTKAMIALQEAEYTYNFDGKKFHILVLPAACGKSVSGWIAELNAAGKMPEAITPILSAVGSSLASLHLEEVRFRSADDIEKVLAFVHGDAHTNNIFFDEDAGVTFIDAAGIGRSYSVRESPALDIFCMLRSLAMDAREHGVEYLQSILHSAFLKGYKSKMPEHFHRSIDKVLAGFTGQALELVDFDDEYSMDGFEEDNRSDDERYTPSSASSETLASGTPTSASSVTVAPDPF